MPELPEVQTTVNELEKHIIGLSISDLWTDWPRIARFPQSIDLLAAKLRHQRIIAVTRRAKYIVIKLSGGGNLYVHQKISGHLLYGKWKVENNSWISQLEGEYCDPKNRFIRLVISLDNGYQIALADQRRFGKIMLTDDAALPPIKELQELGPEPLDVSKKEFRKLFNKKRGSIKQTLMDPRFIAGIGNIYADEILWATNFHPLTRVEQLTATSIDHIYAATRRILIKAIRYQGSSVDDYRLPSGKKGRFQEMHNAYRRTGQLCSRNDGGIIQRLKLGGRSAHFCSIHQRLTQ
ncbi:MAG: bifunctional DNA-formamidopyrimidine glycosylase/DNA-(apurinic or apyrimidinic site) lyase [Patescibacteria group bacterium]